MMRLVTCLLFYYVALTYEHVHINKSLDSIRLMHSV
jgi:hypothetical protein